MLDVTIVNESSPEANRNRRAGGPMCREAASPKIHKHLDSYDFKEKYTDLNSDKNMQTYKQN